MAADHDQNILADQFNSTMAADYDETTVVDQFTSSMAALDDTVSGQLQPEPSGSLQSSSPASLVYPLFPADGLIDTSSVLNNSDTHQVPYDRETTNDTSTIGATNVASVHDSLFKVYSVNADEAEPVTSFGITLLQGSYNPALMTRKFTASASVLSLARTMTPSTRTTLTMPRTSGDCGRTHKFYNVSGWNISTLPIWRNPASPVNRLFGAIKETRPGREPKALLERLNYTPQPTPRKPMQSAAVTAALRLAMKGWNPSTLPSSPTDGKQQSSQNSSLLTNSTTHKRLQKNLGQAASKKAGSPAETSQRQLSKVFKDWNISTMPHWKTAHKFNQFKHLTNSKDPAPPANRNRYTGVKAQYQKTSKRYLQQKEDRRLETERRENLRQLDMKYYYKYHRRRSYRQMLS